MTWQQETDEIRRRRLAALALGGADRVARQHAQGKKTARERLDLLLDSGSFTELGLLATHQSQRPEMQGVHTAADGFIMGYGRIDGREVLVGAEDFTVMGGSVGTTGLLKRERLLELAHQNRVPAVWLFDGSGARALEYVRAGWVGGPHFALMSKLSGIVPQVAAAMGPCAGDPALMAPLADFVVMVKGTSMLAAGGPPVVEAAIGEKVSKEELGGSSVHCYVSGVADNEADSDESCLRMIRAYLAYFPTNVWSRPPRVATGDDPERRDQELLSIVPRDRKRAYDVQRLIRHVVDRGTVFEIKPELLPLRSSPAWREWTARWSGVVASQPLHLAGMIDGAAADKMTHFIQLCDAFHIPLHLPLRRAWVHDREDLGARGHAAARPARRLRAGVHHRAEGVGGPAQGVRHGRGRDVRPQERTGAHPGVAVGRVRRATGGRRRERGAQERDRDRRRSREQASGARGLLPAVRRSVLDRRDFQLRRSDRPARHAAAHHSRLRAARAGATAPLGPKMRHGIMP